MASDLNDIKIGMSTEAASKIARDIRLALNDGQEPAVNPYRKITVPELPPNATQEQRTQHAQAAVAVRDLDKANTERIKAILAKPAGQWTPEDCQAVARATRAWEADGRD